MVWLQSLISHDDKMMAAGLRRMRWGRLLWMLLVLRLGVEGWSFNVAQGRLESGSPSSQSKTPSSYAFPSSSNNDGAFRVVVVGGGVGGMATASRITTALPDVEVVLLEKNSFLGGRCGSFEVETKRGTFRHERGPSLLLLKDVYEALFRECSSDRKSASDYGLDMRQCIPAYQVVFDDGDRIDLGFPVNLASGDCHKLLERSRRKMDEFEEGGSTKWDEYMAATAAYLDCGLPNFIEERLELTSFPNFLWQSLRDGAKAWPLKPHSDVLDSTFESEKMKSLASFQNLYVGLEPYRNNKEWFGGVLRKTAPAVFGLLAAIELHPDNSKSGVFAPIGGFGAVTDAMERLAREKGVKCHTNINVLSVDESGVSVEAAEGVKHIQADLVIMNADLPYATKSLLSDDSRESPSKFDWDDSFDFSSGVIAFHWSVRKELPDLNTHNVFLAGTNRADAQQSWRVLRCPAGEASLGGVEPFNFYVHRASKVDPTAAPKGCDSLLVLVPHQILLRKEELSRVPRDEAIAAYKSQIHDESVTQVRNAVLKRMAVLPGLQDLEDVILDEVVDTPGSYADLYNVGAGTPFGLSHGFSQLSLTRPGAKSRTKPNVLFVGASSRPGNGVPLVLIGAKQVARKAVGVLKEVFGQ